MNYAINYIASKDNKIRDCSALDGALDGSRKTNIIEKGSIQKIVEMSRLYYFFT